MQLSQTCRSGMLELPRMTTRLPQSWQFEHSTSAGLSLQLPPAQQCTPSPLKPGRCGLDLNSAHLGQAWATPCLPLGPLLHLVLTHASCQSLWAKKVGFFNTTITHFDCLIAKVLFLDQFEWFLLNLNVSLLNLSTCRLQLRHIAATASHDLI